MGVRQGRAEQGWGCSMPRALLLCLPQFPLTAATPGPRILPSPYPPTAHRPPCCPPLPPRQAYDDLEHFETAYVVKLFRIHPLAATQVWGYRVGGGDVRVGVACTQYCDARIAAGSWVPGPERVPPPPVCCA